MVLKKKKQKVRRKRCQSCDKLVPPNDLNQGLCKYCKNDYHDLRHIWKSNEGR